MSLCYIEYVESIIPYINNIEFGYSNTLNTRIKVIVKPVNNGCDWGVCISVRGKETAIPDSWFCKSYMQRKSIRINSINPYISTYDDSSYKEKLTAFSNYKWQYDVHYFLKPHLDLVEGVYVITEYELNRFKQRIMDSLVCK